MPETSAAPILLQYGIPGIVLGWFMFRIEGKLESFTRSLDRLTRAQLLAVLASPVAEEPVKQRARDLMDELPAVRSS